MARPMMVFYISGGARVELRNREEGDEAPVELGQVYSRTDGVQVYAYDVALEQTSYSAEVTSIHQDQKDRFDSWFRDTCQGVTNTFTVEIPQHHPHRSGGLAGPLVLTGCHWARAALPWVQIDEGWWEVSLSWFILQEGPTGPPA